MATALSALDGTRPRRTRGIGYPAALLLSVPLLTGAWLVHEGVRTPAPPPQPSRAEGFSQAPAPVQGPAPAPAQAQTARLTGPAAPPLALPASVPVRIRIPRIRVDAPVAGLGLNPDGTLGTPPPDNRNLAGWYTGSTTPGAPGNAVMAGHVDTRSGPAVFWGLGALHKGDTVEVLRADHRTAVFTVDAIEVYPKSAFPSARVYGPTARPELRLITCGGGYSASRGYLGNVVLYAHLTAAR
jgi:hypothetical protein